MNKIIILLGQRVRTGTNFVGSTLSVHPDVVMLPPNASLGEFNLFSDRSISETVFSKVSKKSFGLNISNNEEPLFLKHYGDLWIGFLTKRFNIPKDKTIFIKSPSIDNVDLWKAAFPDSKIAIICRDGRDNVISSVKASNDRRSWHTVFINIKKKLNFLSGRSFVNHAKQWTKTAFKILEAHKNENLKVFKYEDLNSSKEGLLELLAYYDLKTNPIILQDCLNAPVVGSSFGYNNEGITKPNWNPDFDKSKFIFVNKWKKWGRLKKFVFKQISGKTLIALDYEKDNNW